MLALSVAQVWLPEELFVYLYKKLNKKIVMSTRITVKDKSKISKTMIEEGRIRLIKDVQGPWSSLNMWHLEIKNTRGWYQEIHTLHVDEAQLLVNTTLPVYDSDSNPYI